MGNKPLGQEVIDRLLIAKDLLEKIRTLPIANPDRYTIAKYILTAHDAAELAIAAIARYLNVLPQPGKTYLMDYFKPISETHSGEEDVIGKHYFSQLNQVRIGIKHNGIFPDPKQWFRVGELTHIYVSSWCKKYLNISFEDIDESDMISDPEIKKQYDIARKCFAENDYKSTLENIGRALYSLFESNKALRNLQVGKSRAEDALKLSAFGVHANEFLALQEFLPQITSPDNELKISWEQENFGHPANWRQNAAEFCLKTFVSVTLRIQDAEWIPGAIEFGLVYEHKITALVDNVEIVQSVPVRAGDYLSNPERKVVYTLKKGESVRGGVTEQDASFGLRAMGKERKPILNFMNFKDKIWGEIEKEKVSITCVPRDNDLVREYFPDLPEIEYTII